MAWECLWTDRNTSMLQLKWTPINGACDFIEPSHGTKWKNSFNWRPLYEIECGSERLDTCSAKFLQTWSNVAALCRHCRRWVSLVVLTQERLGDNLKSWPYYHVIKIYKLSGFYSESFQPLGTATMREEWNGWLTLIIQLLRNYMLSFSSYAEEFLSGLNPVSKLEWACFQAERQVQLYWNTL